MMRRWGEMKHANRSHQSSSSQECTHGSVASQHAGVASRQTMSKQLKLISTLISHDVYDHLPPSLAPSSVRGTVASQRLDSAAAMVGCPAMN
jgi:hypothetical protein